MSITSEQAMGLTIEEIALAHYLPAKAKRRRANTVEGYESSIRLHVLPRFGGLAIAELGRNAIQDWVDELAGTCGPGGAWKAYKCLRQVIRWAIREWALLVVDVTVGIERPRRPAYRPKTLTPKQLNERVRGMWGHRHEATHILSAALGLRPGEAYALEWADISWRDGAVRVSKTLQQSKGGVLHVYPTKTEQGDRILYLPRWARERLHALWVAAGRPKGRIIGDATPAAVSAAIRRHIAREHLPEVTMQCLRHTWATIASGAGVAIETIARFLGHTSLDMAYEHYMRPSKAVYVDAQRAVARAVMGGTM